MSRAYRVKVRETLRQVIRGAAAGTAEEIVRAVLDDLTGFRGACRAADDVTFVVVKVREVGPPPAGIATVDALIGWLSQRGPGYASAFAHRRAVRCAVNQEFAEPATRIGPGDEVAFFPPVTGG